MTAKCLLPGFVYTNAELSRKPGYLKRRMELYRKKQAQHEAQSNVTTLRKQVKG